MKITNFKMVKATGSSISNRKFFATVDVETGFLFWKEKREGVGICREYGSSWFWTENGKWTPGYDVEELVRAWEVIHGDIKDYPISDS